MKNVLALVALTLAFSLSACTKKEATPEGGEQVEGTTSAPAENAEPAGEMEQKKDGAATAPHGATETAPAGETSAPVPTSKGGVVTSPGSEGPTKSTH